MEKTYAVCNDCPFIHPKGEGNIKKKCIPLTMPMAVKLMHEIITYTITSTKEIISYHIRRNRIAYLAHRRTKMKLLLPHCSL